MTILSVFRLAIVACTLAGLACAEEQVSNRGGAGVQAVVAFMNILDHEIVDEAIVRIGSISEDLALDLLGQLEKESILAKDIAEAMRASLPEPTLGRGVFILYLRDLLNGTDPLDGRDVQQAEAELQALYCGLTIPDGASTTSNTEAVLTNDDIGESVRQFLDHFECIAPSLEEHYRLPVE